MTGTTSQQLPPPGNVEEEILISPRMHVQSQHLLDPHELEQALNDTSSDTASEAQSRRHTLTITTPFTAFSGGLLPPTYGVDCLGDARGPEDQSRRHTYPECNGNVHTSTGSEHSQVSDEGHAENCSGAHGSMDSNNNSRRSVKRGATN